MQFISTPECQDWLAVNLKAGTTLETLGAHLPHRVEFRMPVDTGRKTALVCMLGNLASSGQGDGLFWITGWSVFPSCEILPIFYHLRSALGEQRYLIDEPGHIFEAADSPDVECLIALSLYFYWDASLFGRSGIAIRWNHHEELSVYTESAERLQDALAQLERYDLERIS